MFENIDKQHKEYLSEQKKVERKAKKIGLTVKEYDDMVAEGTLDTYRNLLYRHRSQKLSKLTKIKKLAYVCPSCDERKSDLQDWPAHAKWCKVCAHKKGRLTRKANSKKRAEVNGAMCTICNAVEPRKKIYWQNGVAWCMSCFRQMTVDVERKLEE